MTLPALFAQWTINSGSGVAIPPRWGWYVVLYFFIGGLAAGTFVIATLLDVAGDRRDRDTVRVGYRLAFPMVIVCGALLILDLGKPFRFWHMLIQSHHVPLPMYKGWSAISIGSWILTAFGLFTFAAWINVQSEENIVHSGWRTRLTPIFPFARAVRVSSSGIGLIWGILGVLSGFALGGYTGVLVSDSSAATWHNSRPIGALFLISALSTSYALLTLIRLRRGLTHSDSTLLKLAAADRWAIVLEIITLALLIVSLGALGRPFTAGGFGALFWVGVVGIGLLAPLVLHFPHGTEVDAARRTRWGATCVLVGGLMLRYIVVMAPQWPAVGLFTL
ncbi:MAG: polysulfide reductase NrfD [Gemmatimonadaceae bacterium]